MERACTKGKRECEREVEQKREGLTEAGGTPGRLQIPSKFSGTGVSLREEIRPLSHRKELPRGAPDGNGAPLSHGGTPGKDQWLRQNLGGT